MRKVLFSEGTYEHGQQWYIRGHEKDGDSAGISSSESNEMAPEPVSVNVSDPDFQNFDIGLNRKFLWNDEVWAASDMEKWWDAAGLCSNSLIDLSAAI